MGISYDAPFRGMLPLRQDMRRRTRTRSQMYWVRERERERKRKRTSENPHPPPTLPPPEGNGGGHLILTRSATLFTHIISSVWHKRQISDIKVDVEDGTRAVAGDDSESSPSSSPPSPGIEVYWSVGSASEHWEDLNSLMNDRAESELIIVPGLVG